MLLNTKRTVLPARTLWFELIKRRRLKGTNTAKGLVSRSRQEEPRVKSHCGFRPLIHRFIGRKFPFPSNGNGQEWEKTSPPSGARTPERRQQAQPPRPRRRITPATSPPVSGAGPVPPGGARSAAGRPGKATKKGGGTAGCPGRRGPEPRPARSARAVAPQARPQGPRRAEPRGCE